YFHTRILTDPCFAGSLYGLRRARPAVLPSGALEGLDVILISHAHADHLHLPSLERLDRGATVVLPGRVRAVEALGFRRVVELAPGQSMRAGSLEVTASAARHHVGLVGGRGARGYLLKGEGPSIYF